jgi:hypothetical protein
MSLHMVEKALFDIVADLQGAQEYRKDRDAFLGRYVLEADEVAMIKEMDVREIVKREVNPMLTMRAFQSVEGVTQLPEYLRRLNVGRTPG